nr:inner centromere protein-like [Lytechinus pictus]
MSMRSCRKKQNPRELLEQMLERTTLTTRRIAHDNVEDVGGAAYGRAHEAWRLDKEESIRKAVQETEKRAARILKETLEKAMKKAEEEKRKALEEARLEAEATAERVRIAQDQLEAERIAKLTWAFKKEKEEALRKQWEECERIRIKAVEDAIAETTRKLRMQFLVAKEFAVARALKIARFHFAHRLKKAIEATKEECNRLAAEEAARVAKLHREETMRLNKIIHETERELRDEMQARDWVQTDFKDIQNDYRRFLDYTDGKYHSDYMLRLRKHGMKFDANFDQIDEESWVDIFPLPTYLHRYARKSMVTPHDVTKEMNFAPPKMDKK